MHLLVANASVRCAVVIQGSATILDLKEKVAAQTRKGNKIEWPVEQQELRKDGQVLADEITLGEQASTTATGSSCAASASATRSARRRRRRSGRSTSRPRAWLAAAKADKMAGTCSAAHRHPARQRRRRPGGQDAVLKQLVSCAEILANHEKKVVARVRVHDEYFTQLLERLDSVTLEAVDDADRDELRSKRKPSSSASSR